jgi:hypothetical protein
MHKRLQLDTVGISKLNICLSAILLFVLIHLYIQYTKKNRTNKKRVGDFVPYSNF